MESGDLTQVLLQLIANPEQGFRMIQSSLSDSDNEHVVQVLFNSFKELACNPIMQAASSTVNDFLEIVNLGIVSLGYVMHHEQIHRKDLNEYVYYAKLTADGQLLCNNYHPIHLRSHMSPGEIPESFQKLYADQDYLPNIILVWDRGHADSLILLRYQRVNIHVPEHAQLQSTSQNHIQQVMGYLGSLLGNN